MNYRLKYLTLKEVNEMLETPGFSPIFGELMERKKELEEYRKKKSIEREQEQIRLSRENGTLIEIQKKTEIKEEVEPEIIIDFKKEYRDWCKSIPEEDRWTFKEFVELYKKDEKEKKIVKRTKIYNLF